MNEAPRPHPATVLAQLDHYTDPATGGLVPPIQPAVTSAPPGDPIARDYARSGNSAARVVERVVAELDGAAAAAAFSSGSAAVQAVLFSLRPGDHVLLDQGIYYEFRSILHEFGARWGIDVEEADFTDLPATSRALRPGRTRLAWAECPSNPLWRVPDLGALSAAVHGAGGRLLVDATVMTPVLCRPLLLGADLVLHSATKYLNGHGDALAGVLCAAAAGPDWDALLEARTRQGSVLPPFEAWLLARGLRTLHLRMERHSGTALRFARALERHPRVEAVHYPGLPADPHHALARQQFTGTGFGGMVSFRLRGSEAEALAACARFRVFRRGTSLGSPESLVEHRRTTEGPGSTCAPNLIRLSVGLEHPDDLLADLDAALG